MPRREIQKSVYPIVTFNKVGDSFVGIANKIRTGVKTVNGQCDVLDLIKPDGEVNSIFISASLRLFPWEEMMKKPIELEYTGMVKNNKSGMSYANYKIYQLDMNDFTTLREAAGEAQETQEPAPEPEPKAEPEPKKGKGKKEE